MFVAGFCSDLSNGYRLKVKVLLLMVSDNVPTFYSIPIYLTWLGFLEQIIKIIENLKTVATDHQGL